MQVYLRIIFLTILLTAIAPTIPISASDFNLRDWFRTISIELNDTGTSTFTLSPNPLPIEFCQNHNGYCSRTLFDEPINGNNGEYWSLSIQAPVVTWRGWSYGLQADYRLASSSHHYNGPTHEMSKQQAVGIFTNRAIGRLSPIALAGITVYHDLYYVSPITVIGTSSPAFTGMLGLRYHVTDNFYIQGVLKHIAPTTISTRQYTIGSAKIDLPSYYNEPVLHISSATNVLFGFGVKLGFIATSDEKLDLIIDKLTKQATNALVPTQYLTTAVGLAECIVREFGPRSMTSGNTAISWSASEQALVLRIDTSEFFERPDKSLAMQYAAPPESFLRYFKTHYLDKTVQLISEQVPKFTEFPTRIILLFQYGSYVTHQTPSSPINHVYYAYFMTQANINVDKDTKAVTSAMGRTTIHDRVDGPPLYYLEAMDH